MSSANDSAIYLVDEDDIVRDSLKVLIESHGMPVRDFRSAAEFLKQGEFARGDCLVLGFNRVILEGLDLLAVLRRHGVTMPVIFIVGGSNAVARTAALSAGATAYLERPVKEAALICAIKAALNDRKDVCTAGDERARVGLPA